MHREASVPLLNATPALLRWVRPHYGALTQCFSFPLQLRTWREAQPPLPAHITWLRAATRCGQRKHSPAAHLGTWTHRPSLPQLLHLQNKSDTSLFHPARGTLQHLLKELQKLLVPKSCVR